MTNLFPVSRWTARHLNYTSQGLCQQCGKNPLSSKTLCETCREKNKEYQKDYKKRLKEIKDPIWLELGLTKREYEEKYGNILGS